MKIIIQITNILIVISILLHNTSFGFAKIKPVKVKKKQKTISIAVMNFKTVNCPSSLQLAIQDMLAGKLFREKIFTLMERSQMDMIIKEHGFKKEGCDDSKCVSQLGKILSVDKIITGTVMKLNDYRIEVRVINTANSRVDFSVTKNKISSEKYFEESTTGIVQNIRHFYEGYSPVTGLYDLTVTGTILHGTGSFTGGAGFGFGTNINLFLNRPFGWRYPIIINSGFYYFLSKKVSIDLLTIIPLKVFTGYPFRLSENFNIMPCIGFANLFSIMKHDSVEYRADGNYQYKTEFFYNPGFSFKADMNLMLFHRWFINFTPEYTIFFEKNMIGHLFSIDLGLKILF